MQQDPQLDNNVPKRSGILALKKATSLECRFFCLVHFLLCLVIS